MINTKKLIKMAKKWKSMAPLKRKRITLLKTNSPVAEKGHFVVYTAEKRRFAFPISYLSNCIFIELLKITEEEFGVPSDGPIMLPCDSVLLEYLILLIKRRVDSDMEKALIMSISSTRCSLNSLQQEQNSQQLLVF